MEDMLTINLYFDKWRQIDFINTNNIYMGGEKKALLYYKNVIHKIDL